jgi:APA family basic amino acid/polyamine antiporter
VTADPVSATGRPLLRVVGLAFGIAAAIGGTIGTGILRAPGIVASNVPSVAGFLAVWIAVAAFVAVCANSVAELATAVPRAGGPYVFARRALGSYAGFAVGWVDWSLQIVGIGYLALSIGDFFALLFPAARGYSHAIACAFIVATVALNWIGVRAGSRAQDLMSLAKVLCFATLVAAFLLAPTPAAAPAPRAGSALAFAPLVLALQMVYETNAGWYSGIYFSEEDRAPERNVPRALALSVALIAVVYLLINLGLLRVLGIARLAGAPLAVADAAQSLFGGYSDRLVTAIAIVSLIGILNVHVMIAPRILYALARDGLLTRAASQVGVGGTPQVALVISALAALPFAAGVDFTPLFALNAFLSAVVDASLLLAMMVLRRREPGLARPFRAWGYPWLPGLAILGSLALLTAFIVGNPLNSAFALAVLALSYPVYRWLGAVRTAVSDQPGPAGR